MTPTKQQIEEAAENRFPEYPDNGETTNHDTYFEAKQDAFIAGAEWALYQNRWIPVEEALPDMADANPDYPRHSIQFQVLAPTGQNVAVYHYASKEWLQKGTSIFIPNVTHYQPLPTPPTK